MRTDTASILALLAVCARASASCVELQGIVAGGCDGGLDLSFLERPESLGNPLAPLDIFTNPFIATVGQCSGALETPVTMRLLTAIDAAAFSISSTFEPNGVALDVFGDKGTSDARRRCQPADGDESGSELINMHLSVAILYLLAHAGSTYMPWCVDQVTPILDVLGTPLSLLDGEPSTDTPWGLAKAYLDETMSFMMENDGWNADGGLGGKMFNRIPFTGDFHYEDSAGNEWSGYTPKNTPYEFKHKKSWQPLLESNGLGYISTQEHVTPHIGITARFFGFDTAEEEDAWASREVDQPPYRNRYDEVAREVLEASKVAADDPTKQFAISFFDNKFNSLVPLKVTYFLRNEVGDEMVEAYAGPDVGIQTMKASEWEPYIRTMPHAEYPSGSSCLCEAFASALQVWAGTDTIDPPLEFPPPEFDGPVLTFTSWSEMSQMCGDTRVWAGLHFEEAVPAGVELCGGDDMAYSIASSVDGLTAGDERAAIFNRDIGELILRPLRPGSAQLESLMKSLALPATNGVRVRNGVAAGARFGGGTTVEIDRDRIGNEGLVRTTPGTNMRTEAASSLALLAVCARTSASCIELQGIVAGGGDGVLDLLFLEEPESLGNPLAPLDIFTNPFIGTVAQCSSALETPVTMRLLTAIDAAAFSISSMFEPNGVALDVFGDKETSDARRRCQPADGDESGSELINMHLSVAILYLLAHAGSTYMPWCVDQVTPLLDVLGTPLSLLDGEPSTDTPWGLAKAYLDETMSFMMEHDGWNADGGLGGKMFNRIPFTGDFHYEDSAGNEWNGYTPKNTPYEFKHKKSWQPLLESDDLGYISTQEHVTPHIGITARFFGFDSAEGEDAWASREIDRPPYWKRYDEVAREVLEASKVAADDPTKQFAISFFDNKFNSLVPLKVTYFLRNEVGDEMVEAYAGPDVGIQTMKASEWEPYIRTMPHAEYPSGSSCLCEAFASALQVWAGTDTIDPPLEFPPPEFGGPVLTFTSWSEMSQMCGNTRVWAGLHFEEAVPAGVELCGGDDMAHSIASSVDGLTAGDERAAIFNRDIGELILRPL
eukprot:g10813.t1